MNAHRSSWLPPTPPRVERTLSTATTIIDSANVTPTSLQRVAANDPSGPELSVNRNSIQAWANPMVPSPLAYRRRFGSEPTKSNLRYIQEARQQHEAEEEYKRSLSVTYSSEINKIEQSPVAQLSVQLVQQEAEIQRLRRELADRDTRIAAIKEEIRDLKQRKEDELKEWKQDALNLARWQGEESELREEIERVHRPYIEVLSDNIELRLRGGPARNEDDVPELGDGVSLETEDEEQQQRSSATTAPPPIETRQGNEVQEARFKIEYWRKELHVEERRRFAAEDRIVELEANFRMMQACGQKHRKEIADLKREIDRYRGLEEVVEEREEWVREMMSSRDAWSYLAIALVIVVLALLLY